MQESTASRRSFLGHLGLTAAAAAGLALMSASAQASTDRRPATGRQRGESVATFRCCVTTSCSQCGPGKVSYKCVPLVGGCGADYCTGCIASQGTCYYRYTC